MELDQGQAPMVCFTVLEVGSTPLRALRVEVVGSRAVVQHRHVRRRVHGRRSRLLVGEVLS